MYDNLPINCYFKCITIHHKSIVTLPTRIDCYFRFQLLFCVRQIPLKLLHPQNPPNPETHIPRYKFQFNSNLNFYREILRNLSFSIFQQCSIFSWHCHINALHYKSIVTWRAITLLLQVQLDCSLSTNRLFLQVQFDCSFQYKSIVTWRANKLFR